MSKLFTSENQLRDSKKFKLCGEKHKILDGWLSIKKFQPLKRSREKVIKNFNFSEKQKIFNLAQVEAKLI